MNWILRGSPYNFELNLLQDHVGVTGKTVKCNIRRADGYWWNSSAFVVDKTDLTMSPKDATNEPGYYRFTLAATGTLDLDTLTVTYFCSDTGYVFKRTEAFEIKPDDTQNMRELIKVINRTKEGYIR